MRKVAPLIIVVLSRDAPFTMYFYKDCNDVMYEAPGDDLI